MSSHFIFLLTRHFYKTLKNTVSYNVVYISLTFSGILFHMGYSGCVVQLVFPQSFKYHCILSKWKVIGFSWNLMITVKLANLSEITHEGRGSGECAIQYCNVIGWEDYSRYLLLLCNTAWSCLQVFWPLQTFSYECWWEQQDWTIKFNIRCHARDCCKQLYACDGESKDQTHNHSGEWWCIMLPLDYQTPDNNSERQCTYYCTSTSMKFYLLNSRTLRTSYTSSFPI